MELEITKTIRDKVLAAEMEATTWNKDRVWQNIPIPASKTSRILNFYSAAASFTLLICASIYLSLIQRHKIYERISTLECTIAEKMSEQLISRQAMTQRPIEKLCPGEISHASRSKNKLAHFRTQPPVVDSVEDKDLDHNLRVIEINPVAKADASEATPDSLFKERSKLNIDKLKETSKQMFTPKIITAIVGVITQSDQIVAPKKKTKLKFEIKFAPNRNSDAAPIEANKSFTARLN